MRTPITLLLLSTLFWGCDSPNYDYPEKPKKPRPSVRQTGTVNPGNSRKTVRDDPAPERGADPLMSKLASNASNYANKLHQVGKLYNSGDYRKALSLLAEYIAEKKDNAEAYYLRGRCLEATKKNEPALVAYGRAIALDARHIGALGHRAFLLRNSKQYKRCLPDLRAYQSLLSDPAERAKVARVIAQVESRIAGAEDAGDEKKIFDALTKDGQKLTNRLRDAVMLTNQKKFQQAITVLDALLNDKPGDLNALVLRTLCLIRLGRLSDALQTANKANHLAPSDPRPYFQRGKIFIRQQKLRAALREFESYLKHEKDPKSRRRVQQHIEKIRSVLDDG